MKHKGEKLLARLRTGWKPIPYWTPPNSGNVSLENLRNLSKMLEEADVPTEDRYVIVTVRKHRKKRLFKKLNPIWHVLGGQHD